MKIFKFVVVLSAFVLISTVAFAGNVPEYDAVGRDSENFFAQTAIYYILVNQNRGPLQDASLFLDEGFDTNAGQLNPGPCYGQLVALTDVWNQGTYEWDIVLQMKPESDINLNIMDCVLKHNETDLWRFADQTGRFRLDWGELVFNPAWNPLVSATVSPGPFATSSFILPFTLDARTLPGLVNVALDEVSYTSKAHWPEGIVIAMPKTGEINESGQDEWNLKQGDIVHVTVEIPDMTNTVDVRYGPNSVILKYIGIIGTEYFGIL